MSRILDSMHLFCCLQYICNVEFIQFKCILNLYKSTQTDPLRNVECNPIVLHIIWYNTIPPPFRTNVPFREHVIYEWMNIVCIVYIECHELTPVFTSCHHGGVYLYGWDWKYPTFHLNSIPKLYDRRCGIVMLLHRFYIIWMCNDTAF